MKNGSGRLTRARRRACCYALAAAGIALGSAFCGVSAGSHAFVGGATAPAPAAGATLTGNATVVSQYVSRGMRQSWGKPAAQAGLDYVHPSGWSAGTWVSTISDHYVEGGTVEWDLYGGYSGSVGDIGYSALAYYYKYPDAVISATGTRFDYAELSGGLTYKAFYAKYNRTVSRDFFGITNARGTGYLDVGMNQDLGDGWTLNLHAGDGRVAGAGNDVWNWHDAKIGATKTLGGGWSGAVAWTRAWGKTGIYDAYTTGMPNSKGIVEFSNPAKGTLVVSVTRSF